MVIDTSALLAVLFKEKHAEWVITQMNMYAGSLRMSTVNLTETLIHIQDRQPQLYNDIEAEILSNGIRFVAPDIKQSCCAAEARLNYPINLGDCFAYALAIQENCPIITLDHDFLVLDCEILMPGKS